MEHNCWDCLYFDGEYCVICYRNGEWDDIVKTKIKNPDDERQCEAFEKNEEDE